MSAFFAVALLALFVLGIPGGRGFILSAEPEATNAYFVKTVVTH
jgi:hypothetical protein